jgi:hypothetical protein
MQDGITAGHIIGQMTYAIMYPIDAYIQDIFLLDNFLTTSTTSAPEANRDVFVTDIDSFGCLEMGGDFEGVLNRARVETEDPWSIARYVIAGSTLDCDTSTPIPSVTVRQFRSADNSYIQTVTSDGSGAYTIPIYDQEDYFLTAHVVNSPAGITRRDLKGI